MTIKSRNVTSEELQGYKRPKAVCAQYPISPASLWRKVKNGSFPKPVKLSEGITAFKILDLAEWEKDPLNYKAKP
ncbi:AlpA family transcriptional regulator [Polynucleobacter sp. UK-Mo-2m-Kol15]|uniref:helix-turn-helix transcriptional regulator n=1 Tax=Polynucleobacter sp. UK-Mo-2m-Kol15 TaxID=2576916 RepID=UPI001C0C02BE|nr:AlpA family phage regulatory protein [Polynucleobacter sp. UK-Mo-2m-Kol15]MBU3575870.1 AlpA family phage regulatory protein [Polynucleobacter sp. UK-Mo-2m-Kol15]